MTTAIQGLATMMAAMMLQTAAVPPALHLSGDTRACHGRFHLTAKSVSWSSTWSRCAPQPVRVIAHEANAWAFQIEPAKTCPFAVVETINVTQRDMLPATDYPLYMVNGYKTMEEFREHRGKPELSCNMQ